jgi:hypothetical protein
MMPAVWLTLHFRLVQIKLETEAGGFHLLTTAYGSGRVPHVRLSVHGPKTMFFQCLYSMGDGSCSHQQPLSAEQKRWKGLRPVFFGPCTPGRTWGTRPAKWAAFVAQSVATQPRFAIHGRG